MTIRATRSCSPSGVASRQVSAAAKLGQCTGDHSMASEAARHGQGVVLGVMRLIESEIASGALTIIGRTRIPLGKYS